VATPALATATWRPTGPPITGKTRPFRFGAGAGSAARDPVLAPGTLVGRYRVLGPLGEGGMGRVYDAEAVVASGLSLAQPMAPYGAGGPRVALKILRRERNEADHLARFRQEAKAAARVGHPSIVQVIELAELPDHTLYMVMERLYGQSFEDWLEAPGRLREGLGWLAEVARGLHAAHASGVVHRDVKPANLFLHVDPRDPQARVRAKILDFGIAKVVTGDVTHIETQAGTLLGTPYYLAPERALGRRGLDARADLYSLGVILYEMLTGLVPFEDETFMGILAQHIRAQPLDPRQAAPDRTLPEGVCRLTMRLLAKEPAERPADGNALADELEALLHREAAAIDAVVTGPRQAVAVGEETVQLQDLAERPTAAPTERSDVRPAGGATVAASSLAGSSGLGIASQASMAAASIATPRVRTSPRWPLWLLGAAGVVLLGGVASWGVLGARARAEASTPVAEQPVAGVAEEPVAGVVAEPVVDGEPVAEPSPLVEAEPPVAVQASPRVAEPPLPEPIAVEDDAPAAAPSEASLTPTPTRRDGDRTKARRPRPKPGAPPPPDFKDDVYED